METSRCGVVAEGRWQGWPIPPTLRGSSPAPRALSPQVLQQAEGRHRQGVRAGKEVPLFSGPMAPGRHKNRAPSFLRGVFRSRARPHAGDGQRQKLAEQSGAWLLRAGHGGQWRMGSAFSLLGGGGLTTLGHPLGCFAEHSVARTSGVLGAWGENLAGEGNRSALLSAGSSQGSALKCQSLGLLRETSPQHPLGTPCSRDAPPTRLSPAHGQLPCYPTPPFPLWAGGGLSPQGWGLAVLGFAGGSSALPLQLVSLSGVPLPVLYPKSRSRGVLSWWWLLHKKVFLQGA